MKSLYDDEGREITMKPYMQGGAFSDNGKLLFLVNGKASSSTSPKDAGIWIFDFKTGKKVLKSSGSMPFKFEYHPGAPNVEEPEGITYWNLSDGTSPYIKGNLHAILLNNNIRDDRVWFKHYRIDDPNMVDPKNPTTEQIAQVQAAASGLFAQKFVVAKTEPQKETNLAQLEPNLTGGVARPPIGGETTPNGLAAPSDLRFGNIGRTTITLSWQDNSKGEFGVEIHRVEGHAARRDLSDNWKLQMLSQERDLKKVSSTGLRSDEDFDLKPNTVYCYRMRSYAGFARDEVSGFTKSVCTRTLP